MLGVFHTVRAALPSVIERRGYVLIGFVDGGIRRLPGLASYNVAKAGVEHFANALRLEVAHQGVDVGSATHVVDRHPAGPGGEVRTAGFREMISKLPGPVSKTTSVEKCGEAFVKGIEGRKRRINCPGLGRSVPMAAPAAGHADSGNATSV